jgi:hypothetical protein
MAVDYRSPGQVSPKSDPDSSRFILLIELFLVSVQTPAFQDEKFPSF